MVGIEKIADQSKRDRLKASKKSWNLIIGLLRAKLKAFQKAVNGHGDASAQLPELDLKDPFPVEFHTYLASIVDDYDKAIKGADFIMDLQDDFSLTRRKSNKELRELATSLDFHDQKVAEASWWGSQAWAWFALHRLGRDTQKIRIRMLGFSKRSVQILNSIEYQFTSKSAGSDVQAIRGVARLINSYVGGLYPLLEQLKAIDAKGMPEDEKQLPEAPKGKQEPGTEGVGDQIAGGPPPAAGPSLGEITTELDQEKNRLKNSPQINDKDKAVLDDLYSKWLFKVQKPDKYTEDDIADHLLAVKNKIKELNAIPNVNAQTEEEELRKIAQNILKRWISRKMLGGSHSDEIKRAISDEILDAVRKLKELMDTIEGLNRSTEDIEAKITEVSVMLKSVAEKTIVLANDYHMAWREETDPKKRPAKLEENITGKLTRLIKAL